MNDRSMRDRIDHVLATLEVQALEERIAPVKCDKNPEAAECQVQPMYGVTMYGIEPMYGVDPGGG
ncbi:MAG: hypothetical protein ABIJ09_21330 [Pseudomonadota bacterium]